MADKTIKQELADIRNAGKQQRDYETLAIRGGAIVLLLAMAYLGTFEFLHKVGNSSIKDNVFRVVAAVVVLLLIAVAFRRK